MGPQGELRAGHEDGVVFLAAHTGATNEGKSVPPPRKQLVCCGAEMPRVDGEMTAEAEHAPRRGVVAENDQRQLRCERLDREHHSRVGPERRPTLAIYALERQPGSTGFRDSHFH